MSAFLDGCFPPPKLSTINITIPVKSYKTLGEDGNSTASDVFHIFYCIKLDQCLASPQFDALTSINVLVELFVPSRADDFLLHDFLKEASHYIQQERFPLLYERRPMVFSVTVKLAR